MPLKQKKELAALNAPRFTAEPFSVTSSTISIAKLLENVNDNFSDVLPENVLKHFGRTERPDGDLGEDVLYQPRTKTLSDHEVLEMAADEVLINDFTDAEKDAFNIFKKRLARLRQLQEQRAEQEKLIAEPFAKQAELDQKRARYNEVMEILNPKEEQALDSADEDIVQSQSRKYLNLPENAKHKKYSYEWFVNKPDMSVTIIDDTATYRGKNMQKQIADTAIIQAQRVGSINENGNAVVHVRDNGADVIISKNGIRHSLDRRIEVNAPVAINAGEILKNAIQINNLNPRSENVKDTYILLGMAKNKKNEPYIVSFVVNRYTNELVGMDVMYSVNAKTEPAGSLSPSITAQGTGYFTGSTISIARFLDFVNEYFPDVMPEDILKHYGHNSRPDGVLGQDALYQPRTKTLSDHEVLEMAADEVLINDFTDAEKDAFNIFKKRLARLRQLQEQRAEQEKLIAEPFAKQAELDQKRARYNEVMEILNPKEEQALDSADEDIVQSQPRYHSYEIGDENNGSTDTELLEGSEVSATDRSGNGLRKQGGNTRTLLVQLAYAHNGKAVPSERLRAGESGWTAQSHHRSTETRWEGSHESFLRSLSRITLSRTDSVGRVLPDNVLKKFNGTVLKDADGKILSMYHWTDTAFDVFAKGDIGFHFGTLKSAHDRRLVYQENVQNSSGIYKEVYPP